MGLALEVGILVSLRGSDEEGLASYRGQFDAVNRALRAAGLGPHREPEGAVAGLPWSADMAWYSGLHTLRRIAAHLWAGEGVPPPGSAGDTADALSEAYYRRGGVAPVPLLGRLLGGGGPRGPRFDHLMLHSDAEGYYLPLDFEKVVVPAASLQVAGGMIGSSPRLLRECEVLAEALGIPATVTADDEEVALAMEARGQGAGWRRHGVETFCCLRLLEASRISVATGAALVFC